MLPTSLFFIVFILYFSIHAMPQQSNSADKTSFQLATPWNAAYNVQFMTGIAWGNCQDYFTGKYDGKPHEDEGELERRAYQQDAHAGKLLIIKHGIKRVPQNFIIHPTSFPLVALCDYNIASACSKSASKSSTFSIPTE